MQEVEEERNKELDRKIRILGEAIYAMDNISQFKNTKWFGRADPWTRLYPGPSEDDEWPEYRTFAAFMLWPMEGEILETLDQVEEDRDYEAWINSKQYVKALEAYNYHNLLALEKGQSPNWVGECTGDNATTTGITSDTVARSNTQVPTENCVLYNTFLKDRFRIDAVVQTEFPTPTVVPAPTPPAAAGPVSPSGENKGYAKASSPYGDIYIPNKFKGYIGQPGNPITLTVALQDVGGSGRKANGYRFTCIYIH